ncbi:TIGR03364 family FAD-dependent oxidoreductase [Rathayibacter sp. VKM Ac-2857]|uniref:TIGR03364 family FAD-dependent oxidoreductase n=1 Tax=Rathayibacter sp. VKM Ac-2857 TaxID=2739020 RepID=UPI0015630B82|nr:TIGR03364 family FAD-dependent oxidoreductase [Rathayibacter sp. VKM Ac-2857]NQX17231.1 TIGR03364 family FAD-dependent oxidoreductase [Rathayibacter sp. VKM Ac-2857]
MSTPHDLSRHYDVVVVGAGIVGLAHAYEGLRQGARVLVLDQAAGVTGASVRNFGHACLTPQSGIAAEFAREARERWLSLAAEIGFFAGETGTTIVARREEELAVLREFAETAGPAQVRILDTNAVVSTVPVAAESVVGGAWLPNDLQVDPREAAPAIAEWLATQGVDFAWRTRAAGIASGRVETTRGVVTGDLVIVATNHDLDRLYPEIAERIGIVRCRLHMLKAMPRLRMPLTTPLLTGWSLLRYSGFAAQPSAPALRKRLARELPDGIRFDLNQMYTSPPDGSLIVGDTHERSVDAAPFQSEAGFDLLVTETKALFGLAELPVLERWQGVYASAPTQEFVLEEPVPGVHVVTVATGIGMTTALGIAPHTFARSTTAAAVGTLV